MLEYLKKYNRKTIDIYDLAFEYRKKSLLLWSQDEINDFLNKLHNINEEKIIELKKSPKGESKLDFIQRKISINKWNLIDKSNNINSRLFNKDLGIDGSYYLKNNEQYNLDKIYIERLVDFLISNTGQLTLNEIGYLIFKDEKALTQPDKAKINGKRIFLNLKLDINNISYTETIAPFYYPTLSNGNDIIIVENKDTCFSLLRLLKENESNIKGILYGEGRAIIKIFNFLHVYGLDNSSSYLYYGDIDQEGLDIFRSLVERYPNYDIKLSKVLYHNLLTSESRPLINKRNLNNSNIERVIKDLCDDDKKIIISVLENNGCIPQEALNYERMKVMINGLQNRLF